jgi:hypothetical protein
VSCERAAAPRRLFLGEDLVEAAAEGPASAFAASAATSALWDVLLSALLAPAGAWGGAPLPPPSELGFCWKTFAPATAAQVTASANAAVAKYLVALILSLLLYQSGWKSLPMLLTVMRTELLPSAFIVQSCQPFWRVLLKSIRVPSYDHEA